MLKDNLFFSNTPSKIQDVLFEESFNLLNEKFSDDKKVILSMAQETTNTKNVFFKVFVGENNEKNSQITAKEPSFMLFFNKIK